MAIRMSVAAAAIVAGVAFAWVEPAAAAVISYSTTADGTTGPGTVNALAVPGSYGYFNQFTAPTTPLSQAPGYGFYDDLVFSITGAEANSLTSTISLDNLIGISDLQVRLYSASLNPNLPVFGAPVGGAIDAWSTAINASPGATETIAVLPETTLEPGTYVLEIRGNVTGTNGGSYSGVLNLAPVPLPAAFPLLLSGVGVLGVIRRSQRDRHTRSQ
ncbi:MAG TPA: FxDxF family PEP-CTERM protein [Steroidobacteraceae bacterium]|nr:FxDxF family PEP-CTERM protein [Steroidobacteraceae bacterium]